MLSACINCESSHLNFAARADPLSPQVDVIKKQCLVPAIRDDNYFLAHLAHTMTVHTTCQGVVKKEPSPQPCEFATSSFDTTALDEAQRIPRHTTHPTLDMNTVNQQRSTDGQATECAAMSSQLLEYLREFRDVLSDSERRVRVLESKIRKRHSAKRAKGNKSISVSTSCSTDFADSSDVGTVKGFEYVLRDLGGKVEDGGGVGFEDTEVGGRGGFFYREEDGFPQQWDDEVRDCDIFPRLDCTT